MKHSWRKLLTEWNYDFFYSQAGCGTSELLKRGKRKINAAIWEVAQIFEQK